MSQRLDAHFDGELPSDDLTAEERAQVAAFETQLGELRSALSAGTPADMDVRVMRRIAELGLEPLPSRPEGIARRTARQLWGVREVTLRWRPAYPLAAAALLAGLLLLAPPLRTDNIAPAPPIATVTAQKAPVYVQFRLHTTNAHDVALAGSFSAWEPRYPLQQVAEGVWTVLLPIEPGVHDYAFVVDGEQWLPDPYAPQVNDGFGGTNSRLTLVAPTTL
jgi:hypothetical protein